MTRYCNRNSYGINFAFVGTGALNNLGPNRGGLPDQRF